MQLRGDTLIFVPCWWDGTEERYFRIYLPKEKKKKRKRKEKEKKRKKKRKKKKMENKRNEKQFKK